MAAQTRRDLYLSVDGGVTSAFTAAMKAGKSTLADFGKAADLSQQAVRDAFTKLGGGDIANAAKEVEASFNRSFASIRANAKKVVDAPTNIAAFDILSAQATRDGVANAELRVNALREVANAARAAATGDASGDQRAYAVAADANVVAAERVMAAERAKMAVLEAVEAQMRSNGLTSREDAAAEAALAARTEEAARAQAELVDRAEQLRRSTDPLYAAQARYNEVMAEATTLRDKGTLSAEAFAQAETTATAALERVTLAAQKAADAQAALAATDLQRKMNDFQASIDPAFAAQQRLNMAMSDARLLISRNAISLDDYCAKLRIETAAVAEMEGGHRRMSIAGMEAEHVARSFTDSIAAGQSPIRAATMELGRISQALMFYAQSNNEAGGAVGKLAAFLGSGWGMAASFALTMLAPLTAKLFETNDALGDAVKKLNDDADATRIADAAHRVFSRTIEGEIESQKKLNDQLDRQIMTQRQQQQYTLFSARRSVSDQEGSRPGLVQSIADQEKTVADYRRRVASFKDDPNSFGATAAADRLKQETAKLGTMRDQLKRLDASITAGQFAIREAEQPLIVNDVAASMDAKAAATRRYEIALGRLNFQLKLGAGNAGTFHQQQADGTFKNVATTGISEADYARDLRVVTAQRDAAIKAAADAKREEKQGPLTSFLTPVSGYRVTGQFGETRPGHTHAGVDLAVPVGTAVRAPAAGTVDVAGQRSGYGNAIYITFGGGTTARFGHLERFNVKPGDRVEAGQVIGYSGGAKGADGSGDSSGPHLHYEVRQRGRAVNPLLGKYRTDAGAAGDDADKRIAAAARSAKHEADKAANDDKSFQTALAEAQGRLVKATLGLADTAERRNQVDIDELRYALGQKKLERADQVKAGTLTATRAEHLNNLDIATEFNAEIAANWKLRSEQLQQEMTASDHTRSARDDLLNIDLQMADTRQQRLDLEKQLLADSQAARRDRLTGIIDDPTKSAADRAQASTDFKALPVQDAAEQKGLADRYKDPLEQYRDELKKQVGDMNDALKSVETDGLKGLQDGLLGIVSGTESAGSAFRNMAVSMLADLEKLAAEKVILSLFGLKDGGPAGSGSSSHGSLLSFLHLATGGAVFGAGGPRDDRVPALLSHGEYVINAAAYARHPELVQAINNGRLPRFADGGAVGPIFYPELPSAASVARSGGPPVQQHFHVNAQGAVLASDLMNEMRNVGVAAMLGGAHQAQQDMADTSLARIP